MTNFITRLTGITKDDIAKAPKVEEVFTEFYQWLNNDTNPIFYCYGNADVTFLQETINRTTDKNSIKALTLIKDNLIDYAPRVKEYFGLMKDIALKRIVAYYRGVDNIKQSHNSLEDAEFLREVFNHIENEPLIGHPFEDYQVEKVRMNCFEETNEMRTFDEKVARVIMYNAETNVREDVFPSLTAAAKWAYNNSLARNPKKFDCTGYSVFNNIRLAFERNEKAFQYKWRIVYK